MQSQKYGTVTNDPPEVIIEKKKLQFYSELFKIYNGNEEKNINSYFKIGNYICLMNL